MNEKNIERAFYDMVLSRTNQNKDPELSAHLGDIDNDFHYHNNPGMIQIAAYEAIKRSFILGALWAMRQVPSNETTKSVRH